MELAFAFRERYGRDCEITIVSKYRFENDPSLKAGADQIRRSLVERDIKLIDERSVVEATEAGVLLDCGQMIPANAICVATPVCPPSWIAQSLLPQRMMVFCGSIKCCVYKEHKICMPQVIL